MKLLKALEKDGIPYPPTGMRVSTERFSQWGEDTKEGSAKYWAKRFNGGYVYGDYSREISSAVFDDRKFTPKEWYEAQREAYEEQEKAKELRERMQEEAALRALEIWNGSKEIKKEHAYLKKKRIKAYGIRVDANGNLQLPMRDIEGKLWSLQSIDEEGKKKYLAGGKREGHFMVIGEVKEKVLVCEGYATGATLHECTGLPVVVCYDCQNLEPAAKAFRGRHPFVEMVICGDNDLHHPKRINAGKSKAQKVGRIVGGEVVLPYFDRKNMWRKPKDFSDLFIFEGKERVLHFLNPPKVDNEEKKEDNNKEEKGETK